MLRNSSNVSTRRAARLTHTHVCRAMAGGKDAGGKAAQKRRAADDPEGSSPADKRGRAAADEVDAACASGSGRMLASHTGFKVFSCDVKAKDGHNLYDTPWELNYQAISEGKSHAWFLEHVRDLIDNEEHFPSVSHGFSRTLTNIHRAHPRLVFAWDVDGQVVPYEINEYESAGVWVDSDDTECLVIWAYYAADKEYAMHLLYEVNRVNGRKAIRQSTQWAVLDAGEGGHLVASGKAIVCDNECKAFEV